MRQAIRWFGLVLIVLGMHTSLAFAAETWSNTIRIRVSADRQWQCGDKFFSTGGHERYRIAKIYVDGNFIAQFDFASSSDCVKVVEHVVNLPDRGKAVVTVEVGGGRMGADFHGTNRHRIYASNFFVDHNNGELLQDFAPVRTAAAPQPPVTSAPRRPIVDPAPTGNRQCDFNEAAYLAMNPDVARAVRNRRFPSGLDHYQKHGQREGRAPNTGCPGMCTRPTGGEALVSCR